MLHSALNAFGEALKPPESASFDVVPRTGRAVPAYLPLLARFGGLDHEELERALERRPPSNYEYHLDLSKLVRVEEIDPTHAPLDVFAGDLRELVAEDEVEHAP